MRLGALLYVCLLGSLSVAFADKKDDDALLKWVKDNGAELKVYIGRNRQGVRGLFTTQDIKEGEEILSIPYHLVIKFTYKSAAEIAPVLLKELYTPCSRFGPYLKSLPRRNEVLSGNNIPLDLVKYLGVPELEGKIQMAQEHCEAIAKNDPEIDAWQLDLTVPEAVGNVNISAEEFKFVASVVNTRTLNGRPGTIFMVPVLDMANHDRSSKNYMTSDPESRYKNNVAIKLVAGAEIKRGEEVTIPYGNLRNDEMLYNFGFLDPSEPPLLITTDHHKAKDAEGAHVHQTDAILRPFAGNVPELQAEVERLNNLHQQAEKLYRELGPIPQTHQAAAALVKEFQDKRLRSIKVEIERLKADIAAGGSKAEL